MMQTTVYEMGRNGGLQPIVVEGFEIGQRIRQDRSDELGYIVGRDSTGYVIITDNLTKMHGQRANCLSPFTRIRKAEGATINTEQIAQLEARYAAKVEADRIKANEAAKVHGAEVARIEAELRAKYPNANNRYPGKTLKAELTKAFPGVKFSVTSDYNSIRISWTDGPTVEQVEEYSGKYQHGNFNGMEDIYEYNHSPMSDAISNVLGSVNYVSENRNISPEITSRIEADLTAKGVSLNGPGASIYTYTHKVAIFGEYTGLELVNGRYVPQFKAPAKIEAPKTETPKTVTEAVEGVTVRENTEKAGIEIIFSSKPADSVLSSVKANGFRWSKFQKLWYARATEETRNFANSLVK